MSESEWLEIFADNLQEELKSRNMSARDLAEESWVSEATISRYLNKQRVPNVICLVNIARALDLDPQDLIAYDEYVG